jgi:chemotaxis protein methyltransferase CheR
VTPPVDETVEEVEIEALLGALERRYGYDFRNYARASLRRRIRATLEAEKLATVSALQQLLLRDPTSMQRFIYRLSVHVTSMFRDAEFFRIFRSEVVPWLRTYPYLRIWHAGCATGEEVYSMAILLEEEGIYDRCRIYATDISDLLLQRAKRGIYTLEAIRRYTAAYHRAGGRRDFSSYYTADSENAVLHDKLRRNVVFSLHNLVSDGSFNEFNVVLCRNVLIYFDDPLRDRVLGLLDQSVMRGGFLAIGRKESLRFTPLQDRYTELRGEVRVYRRLH